MKTYLIKTGNILLKTSLIFLLTFSSVASVHAESKNSIAINHYKLGILYYKNHNYEDALKMFIKSYSWSGRKKLMFNIAQCYLKLKKIHKALYFFRKYLKIYPNDKQATTKIEEINALLDNTNISIEGGVIGAEVFVNGVKKGVIPLNDTIRVNPDKQVSIKVKSKGYYVFATSVRVLPGSTLSITVSMVKKPNQITLKSSETNRTKPANALSHPVSKKPVPKKKSFFTNTQFQLITLGLISVTAGLGATYASLYEIGKAEDYRNAQNITEQTLHEDKARKYATAADSAFVLGGALIATGFILKWFNSDKKSQNNRKTALIPSVNSNSFFVKLSFRF